ncbi:hypothetical protein L207DRAFT_511988 [Hyaloscypha variabilis F]|uniref:Uncharacterized protein n=1 Tax=Hyaloscypha variabilis (strain UAMH 11265 / GT02V1 / F) TaxID=1149755 RepID=A0A2J6RPS8_HYAVF|nr:hypothetical protein L207DRAFT_511988 [Hyaloscypha variabilis F]
MANIYTYDEKAAYEQRYRHRRAETYPYSSNSSNASSNTCNDEKCNDCNANTRPYSYPADAQPSPCLSRAGERRVRFMVEKPLAPGWVADWNWDVAQKQGATGLRQRRQQDRRREKRERIDAWWANGGQGLVPEDSDDEDGNDDDNREKEESLGQ